MEDVLYNKLQIKELTKGISNTGIVEVRLVNPKRTGSITVRDYYEIDQYGTHEKRYLVDPKGKKRVEKITRKRNLNLSNEYDRILYAHLKNHPLYVKGPNPRLKLVNIEEVSKEFVSQREIKALAEAKISKFNKEDLIDLCRVLLIKINPASSLSVVKRKLFEFIDAIDNSSKISNAERILDELESDDYQIKVSLSTAIEMQIVKNSLNRFMFGDINLGSSYGAALEQLKREPTLSEELLKTVKGK